MKTKFVLLCSIFAILFVSCSSDEQFQSYNESLLDVPQLNQLHQLNTDYNSTLLPFAKALYNAMKESQELRALIREESLEQLNKEYEVLYQFIKDEKIEGGLKVRELLDRKSVV